MPKYSAEQIYGFARQAGFSPDEAATMTAIALAESGGNSRAHNPNGEDSRGLWQINGRAHPDFLQKFDLYNPLDNAKAAFLVSRKGGDISPWTVTHGGTGARYLRHRDAAQAAAVSYGEGSGRGVWTGTPGYGHKVSAAGPGLGEASPFSGGPTLAGQTMPGQTMPGQMMPGQMMPGQMMPGAQMMPGQMMQGMMPAQMMPVQMVPVQMMPGQVMPGQVMPGQMMPGQTLAGQMPGMGYAVPGVSQMPGSPMANAAQAGSNPALQRFLDVAKAQVGDRYVFGAEVKLDDANPDTWDCSEFTQWAAHQAGGTLPDGATAQYLSLKNDNKLISVEDAKNTPGALLFSFDREPRPGDGRVSGAHVAISLGNGKIVEAANSRAGVRESTAGNRFQYAAVVPGISDGSATPLPPTAMGGLAQGVMPGIMPSVMPGIAIGEPTPGSTPAPELGGPDSDSDGLSDALERRQGLDPLRADTDGDHLDDAQELVTTGTDARRADTDGDRLDDAFELAQGLDPLAPDSDADGHLDGSTAADRVDTDGDGLDDALEALLGTNARLADSDLDGFSDALETHGDTDPLNAQESPLHPGGTPPPGGGYPGQSGFPAYPTSYPGPTTYPGVGGFGGSGDPTMP